MPIDFAARPNDWPWPPLLFVGRRHRRAGARRRRAASARPAGARARDRRDCRRRRLRPLAVGGRRRCGAPGSTWRRPAPPARSSNRDLFAVSRHPVYVGGADRVFRLGGRARATPGSASPRSPPPARSSGSGIAREEAHLAARLGEQWTRYAARTPRWLGLASLRFGRGGGVSASASPAIVRQQPLEAPALKRQRARHDEVRAQAEDHRAQRHHSVKRQSDEHGGRLL